MHAHRVVDNQRPVPAGTVFFPHYLQAAGYQTAFVGKWHMGHDDDEPRPGFDHWVSFRGQGDYLDPVLNINGERTRFVGYNTDILTDQALDWMRQISTESQPFFLFLAFKSVHYPFQPAAPSRTLPRSSNCLSRDDGPHRAKLPDSTTLGTRASVQYPRHRPHGDRTI